MPAQPIIKKEPLKNLRSKLLRPALTSHFICEFKPPIDNPADPDGGANKFFGSRLNISAPSIFYDKLALACSDASLPGSSLTTNEINDDFTGVTERHAYRRLYDDRADFTFYVDGTEYYVIRFFEAWIGYAVNEQYRSSREYTYRANWPDFYCVDTLKITKFERDYELGERGVLNNIPTKYNARALQYNFVKAFPINIVSMPVSYEQSQLLKCTVSFTYSRYWIGNLTGSNAGTPSNPNAPGVPELNGPPPPPQQDPFDPNVLPPYEGEQPPPPNLNDDVPMLDEPLWDAPESPQGPIKLPVQPFEPLF